jgi:nitrite reductase/ring-hydroxylating ferredoxin subunit
MHAEQEMQRIKNQIADVFARRERLKLSLDSGALTPRAGFQQLEAIDSELSELDSRYKRLWDASAKIKLKSRKSEQNGQEDRIWIAPSRELTEGKYLRIDVAYDSEPISAVVFRFQGKCLAYRNLCVHMPRQLDCEKDMIFDSTGQFLRCSMHGIVYDPVTGESISEICTGKRLTPIDTLEDGQGIWLIDRRVKPLIEGGGSIK